MIDYWLSFATSLTPNDGKGTPRPQWAPYNSTNPTVLQLNGTNTTVIADNYRQKQIAFLNQNALSFEHRR
jgi:acetylcholinesterase